MKVEKNPYTTPLPLYSKEYTREITDRRRKIEMLKADGAPAHLVSAEAAKLKKAQETFEALKERENRGRK